VRTEVRRTKAVSEGVREGHRTGVGWVEPRFIEARPTVKAEALGGPHAAVRRSTHPTTGFSYTFSVPSRLAVAPGRIEFVILRTDHSPRLLPTPPREETQSRWLQTGERMSD
jgi:hypothetical protein